MPGGRPECQRAPPGRNLRTGRPWVQRNVRPERVDAVDTLAAGSVTGPDAEAVVVDVRAGDAGFDAWAAERSRSLLIFATAGTGNREAARDAVQDALVAVYLHWRRLIVGGEPDAYARRIIVNRHISWWRRLGRRERAAPLGCLEAGGAQPAPGGAAGTRP